MMMNMNRILRENKFFYFDIVEEEEKSENSICLFDCLEKKCLFQNI